LYDAASLKKKKARTIPLHGKIMVTIFWDAEGAYC
jgi:hypothetical protein